MNRVMMIVKTLLKIVGALVLALALLAGWVFYKWKDIGAMEAFSRLCQRKTLNT